MKITRVLQFGMTPNPGGIESFIMNYYRNMDTHRVQFDFVDFYGEIAYKEEIIRMGGKIFKLPFFKKNPIANYIELMKLIKKMDYKVVHVNMLSAAYIFPIIAARKCRVPCIIAHSHNTSSPPGLIRNILDSLNKPMVSKNATHLFACSKEAADWMFIDHSRSENVHILNNAIDTQMYKFDADKRKNVRALLGLERNFVVGHVGRFQYQKNHQFILEIFSEIHKKNNNSILVLIGEGELKESIVNKAMELNINHAIRFLGKRSDVNILLQGMDAFLFPSYYEGLGIAAIEAQAAGLPCYVSDSVPETVNITGLVNFLSLSSSASIWANEILNSKIIDDRDKYIDKVMENNYDVRKTSKWLEEFYLKHSSVL